MENKKVCSETVATQGGWHFRNCSRPVVVEVNGKCYCKIHSPEYKDKKDKERQERYDKEWAVRRIQFAGPTLLSVLEIISAKISEPALRSIQHCGELGVYFTAKEIGDIRAAIAKAKGDK